MTQQATTPTNGQTAPTAPAPAEPTINAELDVEGRSVELSEHLRKEQIAEEQAEEDEAAPAEKAAATPAETPAAPDEPSAEMKERAQRLERAKTIEREAHRQKQQLIERDKSLRARELALQERETRARTLEHALDDPDAFLAIAAERVGVEKMVGWLQDQASPEKVAARQAKRVETSVKSEIEKTREELRAFQQQLHDERAQFHASQARANVEQRFHGVIDELKGDVPTLAHAISVDPRRVIRDADELTEALVQERSAAGEPAPTFADVARELDSRYKRFIPGAEPARLAASSPAGQSAAAKAKTVSNRAAAERSSLLSEEEEDLSLDERAERLIRLARKFPDRV
jgi:hypothetical protein